MNTDGKDIVDARTGTYEFCPNLADMLHDFILHGYHDADDPEDLADAVSKEINDILAWKENVAFEGGGKIFIPVPKFLVEGASLLK